jgi:hypothetical protein
MLSVLYTYTPVCFTKKDPRADGWSLCCCCCCVFQSSSTWLPCLRRLLKLRNPGNMREAGAENSTPNDSMGDAVLCLSNQTHRKKRACVRVKNKERCIKPTLFLRLSPFLVHTPLYFDSFSKIASSETYGLVCWCVCCFFKTI